MTSYVQTTMQPGGYASHQGNPLQEYRPTQATIIQATAALPTTSRYNEKAGLVTGMLHIIAGMLLGATGSNIIAFGAGLSWYRGGWGICGCVLFMATGAVGRVSGIIGNYPKYSERDRRDVIIAYMTMSIISATYAGSQMIFDSVAAGTSRWHGWYICNGFTDDNHRRLNTHNIENVLHPTCGRLTLHTVLHAVSAFIALCEMIVAIVASVFCCKGSCGPTYSATATITTTSQSAPTPQVTVLSSDDCPLATTSDGAYPQAPPV